ncbi:nuclease [Brevundimonas diminuta]|uniref:thermonuclease family protein n=1 Tax=Brevundimonas diminuta TaxID=293 RepID=UPI0022AF6610|nr:nuclease [Brevundimonas diminuta]MCZ4108545.1 nuclease [Brevundimonas diminuta]
MRYTNVRPMRPAKRKSQAKFTATVFFTAVAVFTATMLWPREGAEPVAIAAVPAEPPAYDFACVVEYVNDGDTLRCTDGTRVRFHAIAARETDNSCSPGHPCPSASYSESKAALTRLAGREIRCVRVGTSYNRVTAICDNAAGVEINCAMVETGAAVVWDKFNRQRAICRS